MTYNDWPEDFPPVTSLVSYSALRHNDDPRIRELYDRAKNHEDTIAAAELINKLFIDEGAENVRNKIEALSSRNPNAIIVYVHAVEGQGKNKIPLALTEFIGEISSLEIDHSIVQADIVSKTGVKNTWYRMAHRPSFYGQVQSGREYILVDDVFSAGGTFNELRAYIESNGGKVVNAVTMANGSKSINPQIGVTKQHVLELERRYGIESLQQFLKEESLYAGNHKALTDSEARTILGASSLNQARNRIAAARQDRIGRNRETVVQGTSLSNEIENQKNTLSDNASPDNTVSPNNIKNSERQTPAPRGRQNRFDSINDYINRSAIIESDNSSITQANPASLQAEENNTEQGEAMELDKTLIRRANASSNAFDLGTNIAEKYEKNIEEIKNMNSVKDKEAALKKLHELRTIELEARGHAIGPYTYGPAVINTRRDDRNFDKAIKTRLHADSYMESLREGEAKMKTQALKDNLISRIKEAEAQGLKEVTVNGKTFYKLRKNWTTKSPKKINTKEQQSMSDEFNPKQETENDLMNEYKDHAMSEIGQEQEAGENLTQESPARKNTEQAKQATFKNAYHQFNKIMAALKSGTLSCLPGADGIADTSPAVNLETGKVYHGANLLYLKEHQKQLGFPTAEYLTPHQIDEANRDNPTIAIKEGSPGVKIQVSEFNEETKQWETRNFELYNIAQTTDPEALKNWIAGKEQQKKDKMQTQFSESYKPREPKQTNPEIVCTSTEPEKYLGQYLAAVSMGGTFKASTEQAKEFTAKFENSLNVTMANGHPNPFNLSKVTNAASKECIEVMKQIDKEEQKQEQQQEHKQEQQRGRGR